MSTTFYVVIDKLSTNPELSSNGGDYTEGRTVAVRNGWPLGVRYWTSWDGGFCNLCGRYEPFDCNCSNVPDDRDWHGWEAGELLTGRDHEIALARLANGGFALV